MIILDNENMEQVLAENGPPVKTRLTWCTYAQMHLVTGFAILSGPYEYQLSRLPVIRMSGRVTNVGGRRIRYGLVRFMKDVVRLKNFWRSVAAEQLGYAPKAQWIAPESAVEGREDAFRQAHLSRDPLLIYNDGAESPPERLAPPAPEAALLNEAATNNQDMKDVTGIHDASLGVRSNETSGRAIMARQKEGDIASLTFYDNANAAVLEGGDVINQFIPQVIDGTRVLRGIGEDEALKFIRVNDPMDPNAVDLAVGEFDVVLSTGVSYTTRRAEAANAMMDMIQVYPQMAQVAGDIIAKNMDFPGADKLAERLKKTVPPQFLGDDEEGGLGVTPEQLQQIQQQVQQLMAENMELKTDRSIDTKKLEIDEYNAQTQRIRALSDHWVDQEQLQQTAIKNILEGSKEIDSLDLKAEELEVKSKDIDAKREAMKQRSQLASSTAGGNSSTSSSNQSQPRSSNG
jgi:regulator of replication initiation timing